MVNGVFRRPGRGVLASALTAVLFALHTAPAGAQTAQPPAKPATGTTQAPAAADTKDLPDGRAVVSRHVEAIGGKNAVLAHKSSYALGTLSFPANGMSGRIETFSAAPNRMFVKFTIEGIGDMMEGFDGKVGWSITPMTGPVLMSGKELEQRRLDADFHADVYDEKRFTSVKTLERTAFEGRPCYKVSLVRKDGVEDIEFFDAETGLRAGKIATRESMMGTVTVTQAFSDYKKFGDLMQPTKMTQSTMGVEQVFTITTVEYDKVDPAVFELPAQIKALVK